MTNKLMTTEVKYEVLGEEVKLTGATVKNYLTKGSADVTDQEVVMFINLCKYQKLNPFLNEAYLIKFKGSPAQIITGKEAFMKRAEANTHYDGLQAGLILAREGKVIEVEGSFSLPKDELLGGWAKVYRDDRSHPITIRVNFDEYNKNQSTWKQIPKTMIRKVAIVQALREAFPEQLGALYTEDEIQGLKNDPEQEIDENANQEYLDIDVESKDVDEDQEQKQNGPDF